MSTNDQMNPLNVIKEAVRTAKDARQSVECFRVRIHTLNSTHSLAPVCTYYMESDNFSERLYLSKMQALYTWYILPAVYVEGWIVKALGERFFHVHRIGAVGEKVLAPSEIRDALDDDATILDYDLQGVSGNVYAEDNCKARAQGIQYKVDEKGCGVWIKIEKAPDGMEMGPYFHGKGVYYNKGDYKCFRVHQFCYDLHSKPSDDRWTTVCSCHKGERPVNSEKEALAIVKEAAADVRKKDKSAKCFCGGLFTALDDTEAGLRRVSDYQLKDGSVCMYVSKEQDVPSWYTAPSLVIVEGWPYEALGNKFIHIHRIVRWEEGDATGSSDVYRHVLDTKSDTTIINPDMLQTVRGTVYFEDDPDKLAKQIKYKIDSTLHDVFVNVENPPSGVRARSTRFHAKGVFYNKDTYKMFRVYKFCYNNDICCAELDEGWTISPMYINQSIGASKLAPDNQPTEKTMSKFATNIFTNLQFDLTKIGKHSAAVAGSSAAVSLLLQKVREACGEHYPEFFIKTQIGRAAEPFLIGSIFLLLGHGLKAANTQIPYLDRVMDVVRLHLEGTMTASMGIWICGIKDFVAELNKGLPEGKDIAIQGGQDGMA